MTAVETAGEPDGFGSGLLPQHRDLIVESAITPEVARQRGYVSVTQKTELVRRGFGVNQRRVPGLVIPLHSVFGDPAGYQLRPDEPRMANGRVLKYETPIGKRMLVDVPPAVHPHLGNPSRPLLVTEGSRKADSAVCAGFDCVALLGVWNWRGTNDDGGKVALPDFEVIVFNDRPVLICFDSDVMMKPEVDGAMRRLYRFLEARGADVNVIYLPSGDGAVKVGLDDYLAAGHTRDDLLSLAVPDLRPLPGDVTARAHVPAWEPPERRTLADVDVVFLRWLHEPDLEALHAVLAVVVANGSPGDPVWLLIVAPPSAGKTELIMPLSVLPNCHVVGRMTVASLLSGTAAKERANDATGGVLRVLGDRGVLLNKDFGSVLALGRDQRADVLQALRDIYDGHYSRDVGVDGGRQLLWQGHAGFIAATTPAWDDHHAVISALGDRYVLLRLGLGDAEEQATAALAGIGDEQAMRTDLADAVAGFIGHLDMDELPKLNRTDRVRVAQLGTLAAHCRSVVVRDGNSRDIVAVHPPEQPARLAKQLGRILAAARRIGVGDDEAWRIVTRCALDSIPATRRQVLAGLARSDDSMTTKKLAEALGLPTTTVRRAAEELAAHHALARNDGAGPANADRWSLTQWARERWAAIPEMSGTPGMGCAREERSVPEMSGPPDGGVDVRGAGDRTSLIQPITALVDFSGKALEPASFVAPDGGRLVLGDDGNPA